MRAMRALRTLAAKMTVFDVIVAAGAVTNVFVVVLFATAWVLSWTGG